MPFNYKKNIEETRENFKAHMDTQTSAPLTFIVKRDKFYYPLWIEQNDDKLYKIFLDSEKLYATGKIYYAHIVQANFQLFERGRHDCPADIVFSPDPYFDENPYELEKISRLLFSYKGEEDVPEDIKKVIAAITDEMDRHCYVRLPVSITDGKEVYITTIMVLRKHLPKKHLANSLFPVIADPTLFNACLILPKQHWTKQLKQRFCGKW